jgi:hypothetical protein
VLSDIPSLGTQSDQKSQHTCDFCWYFSHIHCWYFSHLWVLDLYCWLGSLEPAGSTEGHLQARHRNFYDVDPGLGADVLILC